jgi:hypothetical protein
MSSPATDARLAAFDDHVIGASAGALLRAVDLDAVAFADATAERWSGFTEMSASPLRAIGMARAQVTAARVAFAGQPDFQGLSDAQLDTYPVSAFPGQPAFYDPKADALVQAAIFLIATAGAAVDTFPATSVTGDLLGAAGAVPDAFDHIVDTIKGLAIPLAVVAVVGVALILTLKFGGKAGA